MSRIGQLQGALASWSPGDPAAATWLLPELRALLRAQFAGTYRPAATERGWSLDFMYGDGERAVEHVRVFRKYVDDLPPSEQFLSTSNPHFVAVEQRNRVLSRRDLTGDDRRREVAASAQRLFSALGIAGHDQLRVLICDGPRQLAWVGATREEPFTEREAAIVRRLRAALRARLRLERQLAGPAQLAAALDATLEALPTAAFIVGPGPSIEFANGAGVALLERDRAAVLDAIHENARQSPGTGAFSITRLDATGWPRYLLAIKREQGGLIERVLAAQARWGLSVRQTRVLELVAGGASNKDIATTLACAEATVESHITELFRRAGARSRAGLVGRLL